jgi:hypothetical protein
MRRCFAVKSNKENGKVALRERDFESLRPDQHKLLIFKAISTTPVPRQNSIRVQNGHGFEVRNSLEEDFRLSKQVFGDDRESRMQRRKGHKELADTPLPTFIFNP